MSEIGNNQDPEEIENDQDPKEDDNKLTINEWIQIEQTKNENFEKEINDIENDEEKTDKDKKEAMIIVLNKIKADLDTTVKFFLDQELDKGYHKELHNIILERIFLAYVKSKKYVSEDRADEIFGLVKPLNEKNFQNDKRLSEETRKTLQMIRTQVIRGGKKTRKSKKAKKAKKARKSRKARKSNRRRR